MQVAPNVTQERKKTKEEHSSKCVSMVFSRQTSLQKALGKGRCESKFVSFKWTRSDIIRQNRTKSDNIKQNWLNNLQNLPWHSVVFIYTVAFWFLPIFLRWSFYLLRLFQDTPLVWWAKILVKCSTTVKSDFKINYLLRKIPKVK